MLYKTKKTLSLSLIIVLTLTLGFAGCSAGKEQPRMPELDTVKPITLRLAHVYAPYHPFSIGMVKLADKVKAKSNGKLIISTYDSGTLGTEKDDIAEGMINGIVDMAIIGPGELGKRFKPILIFDAPYVFKGVDHMQKVTSGPVGQQLWDQMARQIGIRTLSSLYYGTRYITTTKVPVKTPSDLVGLKLRTPDQPLSIANAKAMGATPVPMALFEVYMALQHDVVEGQENPIPTISSQKLNEVQNYINLTGHVIQVIPLTISEKKFASLPQNLKEILIDSVNEVAPAINKEIMDKEIKTLEEFKKNGMKVVEPDVALFKKATGTIIKEYEDIWGKGLYEKIQSVQ
ncbi:MAG: DctP family transporter solute-binding subunit [Clostridiales bacterium]|nr:DctP family transporter solute-binding subunit [Clostridiales bacterium]